jgi:CRP/FNR family transcriptional regulator, anaerobic regulatory protein
MNNVIEAETQQQPAHSTNRFWSAGVGERYTMHDLLQLMGAHVNAVPPEELAPLLTLRRLQAGNALFHEGAPVEWIYVVRSGTFKTFRTAEDGYEQVLPFASRGELLGFDALSPGRHPTAAVALEDASAFMLPVHKILSQTQRSSALDLALQLAASRQLAHCSELADLMSGATAEVRLARFILQWSRRMGAINQAPLTFYLRMTRRDIASYIGVAHETVSRCFSALTEWGYLQVDNREIEITDLDGLKCFARNSRKQVEEPGSRHGPRRSALRPVARQSMC